MSKSKWLKKQIKRFKSELQRPSVWDIIASNIYVFITLIVLILIVLVFMLSALIISGVIDPESIKGLSWIN